jgi:hypothetical protein
MKKALAIVLAVISGAAAAQDLTVTPSFDASQFLPRISAIQLQLSREITPEDGRLAIFIDQTDVTALFNVEQQKIVYQPDKLPLPAGAHELILYLVPAEGGWRELTRIPIKVLTRMGFEKALIQPAADFTGKAQPYASNAPDENQPVRDSFEDGTLQMTISSEHLRNGFALRTASQITGVTYRNEALRFGQLGDDAPPVDLGSYRIDLQRGSTVLSVGHLGFGSLRHLVNGFSSRGIALKFGEGRMVSLQLAALNGSNIVGWDNFFGLGENNHRIYGATVGLEAIPRRPGGLRIEGTVFGGSLLPFSGFNQGAVLTAEESDGGGLRVVASDPSQRFTVDAGYTSSTFHEARDRQVEDGLDVTPIRSRTNNAQYADATVVLLRNRNLGRIPTNVSITARHERVEPLFRSVGAPVQADLQTNGADLTATFGQVSAQLSHVRTRDNIGGVESILTTKTRRTAVGVGIPLNLMVRNPKIRAAWFPTLTIQTDLTHQFGTHVPVNSGFDETHVPDQMSTNGSAALQWQIGNYFRIGYRLGQSHQDNRQLGNENADFTVTSNAVSFGFTAGQRLNASIDLSLDENDSELERRKDRTRRYGTNIAWTLFGQTAVGATITMSEADNNFGTLDQRGTVGFLELSSGFPLTRKGAPGRQGRVFVRYSEQQDRTINRDFGFNSDRRGTTVTSGVTLSVH